VISVRCFQARHLLRPSSDVNQLLLGIVARACRRSRVRLIAMTAMSNHIHYLIWTPNSEEQTSFMHYVDSQIPREIGRLCGWQGAFWGSRYQSSAVTDEESAQVEQLRYLLAQGCKENLVSRPRDWPGLHAAKLLLSKKPLKGIWIDRTAYAKARHRLGHKARLQDHVHEETLELSPLPCWSHLSPEEYRGRVRSLIEEVEDETRARHQREGSRPLGRRQVLRQDPKSRPKAPKKSRLPLVRATTTAAKALWLEAYGWFVKAFREASSRYRQGEAGVIFPPGSYQPSFGYWPVEARAG